MGWLIDLWLGEPKSYDGLAGKLLEEARRAGASAPKNVRSLGNSLRNLDDKGQATWWKNTGKPLVPILARLLGQEADKFEGLMDAHSKVGVLSPDQAHGKWKFDSFERLGDLDLHKEDPFPGMPRQIFRPGGPVSDRIWWVAGVGAGKTLAGHWLNARHGWQILQHDTWESAVRELPSRGLVYLELASNAGKPAKYSDVERLNQLRLCVSAPFKPPMPGQKSSGGHMFGVTPALPQDEPNWEIVGSPPVVTWLEPLLRWVDARLKSREATTGRPFSRTCRKVIFEIGL